MSQVKGVQHKNELRASRKKRDVRRFGERFSDTMRDPDVLIVSLWAASVISFVLCFLPLWGELSLLISSFFYRKYLNFSKISFDFPFRIPSHAGVLDGSTPGGKSVGKGVTFLGTDLETNEQIYSGDSDQRTHSLVLGTTGSGKTEYLLGIFFNALVQNTGCIYVDGKGDPKLQKEVFRLARLLGRVSDLLIINFITSGRDFVDKQRDKVTNNMNMMANTSSGMLIELIIGLMDSSGGGGDMWKGRAISFVAAITRPLVYLRDKGFINLSPETYLSYFELHVLEELVFEHGGKYGEKFDVIVAPLRNYLVTLPGYQTAPEKRKKQETKTLEQHGFIVMQLTRIFNDLTYNYGHIFKVKRGDVDFYDVVINRRLLIVLLPALENSPDSLQMLGKLIVGSVKQMMAGCLGNRVEGVVREIIDSRPTNSKYPFYTIFDEYGYYAVAGFAVAPAQARSLGFSMTFAAQDFSSLKKSSEAEADATWENTNVRVFGRLTSGEESETWRRVVGATSTAIEAEIDGVERSPGMVSDRHRLGDRVQFSQKQRVHYDDFAKQENGDFTFVIGKKERNGNEGGVRVIRGRGFYTASKSPKEMRLNDFVPVVPPEPNDLPEILVDLTAITTLFTQQTMSKALAPFIDELPLLKSFTALSQLNEYLWESRNSDDALNSRDLSCAQLGMYLENGNAKFTFSRPSTPNDETVPQLSTQNSVRPVSEYAENTVESMAEDVSDVMLLTAGARQVDDEPQIDIDIEPVAVKDNEIETEFSQLLSIDDIFDASNELAAELAESTELPEVDIESDFLPVELRTDHVNLFGLAEPLTEQDNQNFTQRMKVFFDFSDKEHSSVKDSSRNVISAMYHAQLMSLFSQGRKVTAKMIRDIKDDMDNEYQRLLESTSYLQGQPPQKADIEKMRKTIFNLSLECGNYLKTKY